MRILGAFVFGILAFVFYNLAKESAKQPDETKTFWLFLLTVVFFIATGGCMSVFKFM